MTKIYTPVEGFTGTVCGVNFADGAGESDDPNALAYFRRHGYQVEGDPAADGDDESLAKRSAKELRAYAKENDIDLGGAKSKAAILEAINAATTVDDESEES